eukprot:CAMPEP_0113498042 /NCGR_PEP_ID=MMETSP0014_2-20120614/30941_1 /TAXON_ID=2857 /ORGANISM="Nitzschia sp." /LENGTH=1322 /DNA_ID=CAMNT_0000391999 /DNA_START=94 /DNA_END=4062 /DNA_ORIENTATION=- /assembly_acc=CAM_ASM_000159
MTVDDDNDNMEMSDGEDEFDDDVSPSLIIPIKTGSDPGQFVEIFPEEMSDTPSSTLLQVLQDEDADLSVWADAALGYIQHKSQSHAAAQILEAGCERAKRDGSTDDRVRIYAAAGISHLTEAADFAASSSSGVTTGGSAGAGGANDRQLELTQKADNRFTFSSKVDNLYPMTWMGKGMLNLSAGRLDQAKFFFDTTLKQCGQVLPALLGLAAVAFSETNYKLAQDLYGEAIRRYPTKSGASSRVGFGLACYRLGQVDRAKAAFTRALDIDPENVEAMVAVAVLDMSSLDENRNDFSIQMEKAIRMISTANLLDHSNAMVQNHLANHYFWKWTPVSGTVEVTEGFKTVKCSQPIPLDQGERIRIGTDFESIVAEDVNDENDQSGEGMTIQMSDVWKGPSKSGLKLWKKDFERVISLARGAYNSTPVPEIQAESLFILARVYHTQGMMDDAVKAYKKACNLSKDLTPAKFGLAQVLIHQEQYEEAAAHLKDVIGSSGTATDALAALGLLEVKSGTKMQEGLARLRKAIDLSPLDPNLILLEALALQQHESNYPKALERYKKAVELMQRQGKKISFEIYTNIGVLCHETRNLDESLESYKEALDALDEDGVKRVPTMDNVGRPGGSVRHKDNRMFYGFLDCGINIENPAADIALGEDGTKLVKVVQSSGTDPSTLPIKVGDDIRIGKSFESTVEKIEKENNTVVLSLKDPFSGEKGESEKSSSDDKENSAAGSEEAEAPLEAELSVSVKRENARLDDPLAISIAFNLARLHETSGRILPAVEIHKAILKRNPAYVNSYLRLACIAIDCGALNECAGWLKIAAETTPGNPEVLTLIGNLHLSLCDWKPAQQIFDGLLSKKVPNVESYSLLSMATIFFSNLDIPSRYAKHLNYAGDYYKRILTKDHDNAYAANGLGTCLAERADLFKAKEIFNRVREVTGDSIADAHLNLAHIYLAQKKHPEALQMYQSYLKKTEDGSAPINSKSRLSDKVDVLQYIAFSYFDWACQLEQYGNIQAAPADERYREAIKNLDLALEVCQSPSKTYILKYNLCRTKLQAANCVLQKLERHIPRTAKEVEEALTNLQESLKTVQEILSEKKSGAKVVVSSSTLDSFISLCKVNIDSAKHHLEDEKKREEEAEEIRRLHQLQAETKRHEQKLLEERQKEEETKRQEELDIRARQKMEKVKALQQDWEAKAAVEADKKTKKASKDPSNGEDATELVEEDDQPASSTANLFDDSDDDSDDGDGQGDKSTNAPAEQTSEEAAPAEKTTAQDLFGDSDSDEDSDEELKPSAGSKRANDEGAGDEEPPAKKAKPDASSLFDDSDSD